MSERPVFKPTLKGDDLVETINVEFTWFSGFSKSQKQKSIQSLHEEATKSNNLKKILEISTKSEEKVGVSASAFNIKIRLKNGLHNSVESFYQGSKVFKNGGPFVDLYQKNSLDSKKDQRLQSSGGLKGFIFQNEEWELDEHFYDWLYLNALIQNKEIAEKIIEYDAFTDIEFNPKKSFNCQAYTAALFKAAVLRDIDLSEFKSPSKFKESFPKEKLLKVQIDLF
jgi:hypothetical protein